MLYFYLRQCTVASKLLTLTESVRDAADLYLSLKYPPTTFICDSACGLSRHLELRNKELAQLLWGENGGCFERPTLDKLPTDVCVVFLSYHNFRSPFGLIAS